MLSEHQFPAGWPLPPDEPFTLEQARAAKVSRVLHGLLRARVLRRPLRNVYVSAAVPDSIVLRATCVALVMPPGCFVTDRCAGWLHGADMTLAPNEDVLVPRVTFFRPSDEGRLRNGLCLSGERHVERDELIEIHGILATTQLRTALDLGRLQRPDAALAGMDSMARLGGFDVAELVAGLPRFKGQRGVAQLRELVPIVDPGSESYGESATRRRWHDADLPWPTTQISVVQDGLEICRLDLGLPELQWAVEYKGRRWHTAATAIQHDAERIEWLDRSRGYLIDELDHTHVFGAEQDARERLRAGFEHARDTFDSRRRRFEY